jgi:hypothetical protein
VIILLMYTQSSLSFSVYDVVFYYVVPGLFMVVYGFAVSCCVFCIFMFYCAILLAACLVFFYLILFISLAITKSTCLLIMACSSSSVSFYVAISCVGSGSARSFPFFVYCFWTAYSVCCFFPLGPGYVDNFSGNGAIGMVVVMGGTFLIAAISTCRSIIACTIFVGLIVSGSMSSMNLILVFSACTVSCTLLYLVVYSTWVLCVELFSCGLVCVCMCCSYFSIAA